ncbi:MAG: hypothetical protein PHE63_12175 [Eubacteriales bacterium]|nr:hypothetical protein [Eubacteriales bacterium]MDD3504820.1 hypothetical protein [Eubacteriales bacterium]
MAVPQGIETDRLQVVHIKSDGTVEVVKHEIVNGKIVFKCDSFSICALVEVEVETIPADSGAAE